MGATQSLVEKFRWNRSKWLCGALLVRMGMVFQTPVPDSLVTGEEIRTEEIQADGSGTTSFSLAGGGGTYFREALLTLGNTECGPIREPITGKSEFTEVGVAVDHQLTKHLHMGIRGGYVWTNNSVVAGYDTTLTAVTGSGDYLHAGPYIAVEGKYFGVGVGGVFSGKVLPTGGTQEVTELEEDGDGQVSGHLRVGSLNHVYANVSRWEGVPLITNGHVTAGVGVRPFRPLELYAGYINDGPYQTDNWMGRIMVDANPNWSFYLNMRFPKNWNNYGDEWGTAFGATYRIVR